MVNERCLICDKKLTKNQIRNQQKFCSYVCCWEHSKLYPNSGTFRKGHKRGVDRKFSESHRKKLSISHVGISVGEKAGNWKGGMVSHEGYILSLRHEHPNSNKRGYIAQHRLVAEKVLGRYLAKKEVIHHINGIKDDNCPENLYLFPNQPCHMSYHILLKNNLIKLIDKSNLPIFPFSN